MSKICHNCNVRNPKLTKVKLLVFIESEIKLDLGKSTLDRILDKVDT